MTSPAGLWPGGLPVAIVTLLMESALQINYVSLIPFFVAFPAFFIFCCVACLPVVAITAFCPVLFRMGFMIE